MKKKTSRKRHLFLTKNFIMMLVMLVVIIVAVSAWFTVHKTVTAGSMMVKAESSEIDIAPAVKKYNFKNAQGVLPDPNKAEGDLLSDGPGEFDSSWTFTAPEDFGSFTKDCTGDGLNLIIPDFNITNDYDRVRTGAGKDVNLNVSGKTAISQEYSRIDHLMHPEQDAKEYQYLEFEFYARSKNPSLRLASNSVVLSETEKNGSSLSAALNKNDPKRSAYGNGNLNPDGLNVDGLVGAIRVSLLGEACSEVTQTWKPISDSAGTLDENNPPTSNRSSTVKQILWYPRPDVKLNIPDTPKDITNWSLDTGLTGGDSFINTYYKNTPGTDGVTLVSNDTDRKTVVSPGDSSGIPTLGQNFDISDFPSVEREKIELVVDKNDYQKKDFYYVTKYILRVWIEGTDTEARRAMDGGKFSLTLNFM